MVRNYIKKNNCPNCHTFLKNKTRKNYFTQHIRNKQRNYNLILKKLQEISNYCNSLGLSLLPVEICPFNNRLFTRKDLKIHQTANNNEDYDLKVMKAFDMSLTSYNKYQSIKNHLKDKFFPSKSKVVLIRKKIDTIFNIRSNQFGFYFDARQKITFILQQRLEYLKEKKSISNNTIKLKFCADGIQVTKSRIQLINFSFSIIDDIEKSMSPNGHYILGE